MTLHDLTQHIKTAFERLYAVNSYHLGDVYAYWNAANVQYLSVVADLVSVRTDENAVFYTFRIHAADRETQIPNEHTNYEQLQNVLELGLNYLNSVDGITIPYPRNYTVAHQKFMDVLSIMYIDVEIEVENDIIGGCYDE